jgi:hypothetical protein
VEGRRIEVTSRALTRSSSANRVESVRRVVMLEGDDLTYDIAMAAAEQPLQGHLKAGLHRT